MTTTTFMMISKKRCGEVGPLFLFLDIAFVSAPGDKDGDDDDDEEGEEEEEDVDDDCRETMWRGKIFVTLPGYCLYNCSG